MLEEEIVPQEENILPPGLKLIDIPTLEGTRRAYADVDPKYLDFKHGIRVLPAIEYNSNTIPIYFVKKHEPGEKTWKDGGYECIQQSAFRAFHLDALIIHPYELRNEVHNLPSGVRRRGRKRKHPLKIKDPNTPKGKRGRKPLSLEEKNKRDLEKQSKPKRGKRGRPPMDPSLRKPKPVLKGYAKRGRPPKNSPTITS